MCARQTHYKYAPISICVGEQFTRIEWAVAVLEYILPLSQLSGCCSNGIFFNKLPIGAQTRNFVRGEMVLLSTCGGYGKIMRLIYWHIIGWLEYGNFVNAIRHASAESARFGHSVNTRLFLSANREFFIWP